MSLGTRITVTVKRTEAGAFDGVESIEYTQFTHDDSFITNSSVKKDDIANSGADRYVVTTNWSSADSASVPTFTSTGEPVSPAQEAPTTLASDAITKINVAFPGTFS